MKTIFLAAACLVSQSAFALSCKYVNGPTTLAVVVANGKFVSEHIQNTRYPVHIGTEGVARAIDADTLLLTATTFHDFGSGLTVPDDSRAFLHLSSDRASATLDPLNGNFTKGELACLEL